MQYSIVFSVAALAASAAAQNSAVTQRVDAPGAAPAGCVANYDGQFQITVVAPGGAVAKRANNDLFLTLQNGVLTEQRDKTIGYVASNYQFQFGPPQSGEIYNAGFSLCANNTLAHGDSTTWYSCNSGAFNNLYDRHWAAQCEPINFLILPASGAAPVQTVTSVGAAAGVATATQVAVTSASIVSGIADGQPQAPTAPVAQTKTAYVVTQIADGQPQGPTVVPVTQIGDGQPQAPTGVPVSQIADGQPQAPTGIRSNATIPTAAPRYTGAASSVQAGSAFALVFGAVAAAFL